MSVQRCTSALTHAHTHSSPLFSWCAIAASPVSQLVFDWLPYLNVEEVECCYANTRQGQWQKGKREWCVMLVYLFSAPTCQSMLPREVKGWQSTKDSVKSLLNVATCNNILLSSSVPVWMWPLICMGFLHLDDWIIYKASVYHSKKWGVSLIL